MDENDPTVFLSADAFDSKDESEPSVGINTEGLVDIPPVWGQPDVFDRKFLPFY